MLISLDNSSSTPLYQQIIDQIKARIIGGQLRPGDPLPSIRQLASELLTSVITTKRAYQDLEAQGLIVTRPGIGTFVNDLRPEEIRRVGIREIQRLIAQVAGAAVRLGLSKQEMVEMLSRALDTEGSR